jgi:hypothetical protein
MTDHRVPMRRGSRYVDPAHSGDPAIRKVVAALATLDPAPAVRPEFRARLRAELVSVSARAGHVDLDQPRHALPEQSAVASALRRRWGRVAGLELGRPLRALAGAAAVLIMLAAAAVLLSRGALPGDALYGVKRASEAVELATTSGAVDRGELELTFAGRRISETISLVAAPAPAPATSGSPPEASTVVVVDGRTASLIDSTLGSGDSDVRAASRLLGAAAVQQDDTAPLFTVLRWVPAELSAVQALHDRLAPGAARDRVAVTAALLERVRVRAQQLIPELGCACLTTTRTDALGPVPCATCAAGPAPSPPPTPGPPSAVLTGTPTGLPPASQGGSSGTAGSSGGTGGAAPASTTAVTGPHSTTAQSGAPQPGGSSAGPSAAPGVHGTGTRTHRPPSSGSRAPGSSAPPRPTSSAPARSHPVVPSLPVPLPSVTLSITPPPSLPISSLPVPLPSLGVTLPGLPGLSRIPRLP